MKKGGRESRPPVMVEAGFRQLLLFEEEFEELLDEELLLEFDEEFEELFDEELLLEFDEEFEELFDEELLLEFDEEFEELFDEESLLEFDEEFEELLLELRRMCRSATCTAPPAFVSRCSCNRSSRGEFAAAGCAAPVSAAPRTTAEMIVRFFMAMYLSRLPPRMAAERRTAHRRIYSLPAAKRMREAIARNRAG